MKRFGNRLSLVALVVAIALSGSPAVADLRGWFTGGAKLMHVDYTLYYASALQGLQEGWPRLWDLDAQHRVFARIGPDLWWFPNVYTPAMSLLMIPFTHLSLESGYLIWSAILLASMLVCGFLLAPGDLATRAILMAMAFLPYPVVLGLVMGQVIALQMAALAIAYVLLNRGHEKSAGVMLVMIALKPQGMLLVPFALLVAGRRKAFFAWAASMAAVGAVVLPLIGLAGLRAYLSRLGYAQSHPGEFWVGWAYNLSRHFEDTPVLMRLAELAAIGLALLAAFRQRAQLELVIAAALVGSLLATPFLHLDDLMLLFPAGWLVLRAAPSLWNALGLLVIYAFMMRCDQAGTPIAGRWVLLGECIGLVALATWPRRFMPGNAEAPQPAVA